MAVKFPCPEHPTSFNGPLGDQCIFCNRSGYSVRASGNYTIDRYENEKLETQFGRKFDDRADLNRHMASNDLRFMDKGDRASTGRDEIKRWKASGETAEARGKLDRRNKFWSQDGAQRLVKTPFRPDPKMDAVIRRHRA